MSCGFEETETKQPKCLVQKSKHCRACVAFLEFVSFVQVCGIVVESVCHATFTDGKTES